MKKLKALIILAIIALISTNVYATIHVTGAVTKDSSTDPIPFAQISIKGTTTATITNASGIYEIDVPGPQSILVFEAPNYEYEEVVVGNQKTINVSLKAEIRIEIVEDAEEGKDESVINYDMANTILSKPIGRVSRSKYLKMSEIQFQPDDGSYSFHTEGYDVINENGFKDPISEPLSTFSIDVDAASHANVRRMINNGSVPHKDAVRIEEMINYFNYDYSNPEGNRPFSITTEVSYAPWNAKHRLVHIGLQGKKVDYDELNPTNLVFLIDVSGSMNSSNKLPLLKSSLKLLVDELSEKDRVAIVVYAGAAGLVLPSTPASDKETIKAALDRLTAGGSTAGGAGIELAYKVAKENLIKEGNNRVVLATDGDFNIGASSNAEMVRLIEEKRSDGIFLTITGFGMGNYKDDKMEQISNAGNGNYYYIDNIKEAKKIFVTEMRGTLFTIAKDVKLQVEFNPEKVQAYRLVGYENRMLNAEDFNDDKKDAGELGAGHTVTALYEIIPVGIESEFIKDIDPLKYQNKIKTVKSDTDELLTVKFRYKAPDGDVSQLITKTLKDQSIDIRKTSENYRFSAAVAQFGMVLRNSEYLAEGNVTTIYNLAASAKGNDTEGYRDEFLKLVDAYGLMVR